MKKYTLIFISLFIVGISNAQISKTEILKASENFIYENTIFNGYSHKSEIIDLKLDSKTVAYLVNLQPEGYIIFTASKKLSPIFSYSEKGNFDASQNKKNPVFQIFLKNIAKQQKIANENSDRFKNIIDKNKIAWADLLQKNKSPKEDYQYGYYLTDTWGGVNCWDNEGNFIYPTSYFNPNHYSAGCVAISAAQILNYYEWPPVGVGSHTDYDNSGSSQGTYYAQFGTTKYDWKNMLDDYQGEYSTDTEQRAIGRLMYHVGVAVDMDYEDLGSTSNVNQIPSAFQSYFRTTGHYETWSWSDFGIRMRENLENGMPVQFGIMSDEGEQHACVCDGYRYNEGEPKFYHLNMGWWNWYGGNAWYNIYDEFSAVGYTSITGGVLDILPKPMMNKVIRTTDYHQFIVNWNVSKNLQWEVFELEESYNNGSWSVVASDISDTLYTRTVSQDGIYKYRVRSKVGGAYYTDSYSNIGVVQVGEVVFLNFDGDDSFFINDSYDELDVANEWTYEAWVKVNTYNSSDWSVIMDRRGVFSLYLIDDTDADFAVRFVTRDGSDGIVASLRSDESQINLEFGKWFHTAVSFDGTTARLFINGNLIEESTDPSFIFENSTNALNVGGRYWGSYSRYITGQIDEVHLTANAKYTEEFCPDRFKLIEADENTRLLLNLQYGTGTALYDATHNFLNITLRDAPNTSDWQTESSPVINIQPISYATCGGNANFSLDASNTDNYQWQIYSGTNFTNLTDDANISGSTTNSLNISDVSSFTGDNIIRCILSNTTVPHTCSQNATLDIYENCTIWDGTAWSNGNPNSSKSAIIDANYTASEFMTTDNLTINENDTLYIDENFTLNVLGDFINNGTLFLMSENANQIPGTFIHTGNITNYGNMIANKAFAENSSNCFSNPTNSSNSISSIFNNNPNIYENTGSVTAWNLLNSDNLIKNEKAYLYENTISGKAEFSGLFNSGDKTNSLKVIGNNDFYAFVPNPYPSYINWKSASWNRENISPTLYTYDVFNSASLIRQINGGNLNTVIYTHPENIEVSFNPGSELVTVENKSTDATHYWNVTIIGGATGRGSLQATNYKANYIRDDGTNDYQTFDLGSNDMGWFQIICTDQNNEQDGFIINVVYFGDDINGTVQYWDN